MLRWVSLMVLALLTPAAGAHAAEDHDDHDHTTQLGAHVHGAVTVNLALESDLLVAELDAPALQVLGFEKAPRSAAERASVADVDRWLASGRGFLAVPTTAGCRWLKTDYSPPALSSDHADYRVRTSFRCSQPSQLDWVELWMLRRLQGVEKVEVNLVTPSGQRQVTLPSGTLRVPLR